MKMIFVLKDTVTGEIVPLSDQQKEYIVGRKNCDILLESDQSISRKHAVIRVKGDHVTLADCKSKYHTLHNGKQVTPESEIRLEHMDSIQFGVLNSKFSFEAYKFITAGSALSPETKLALKADIVKCNGKYVEKWSNSCTHLTVDKLTLTIKVLQALIDEKPIVTPEYWLKYAHSIENQNIPPDINNYNKPPIAEQLLRSDFQYKLDPRRKKLFKNKIFVFLKNSTKKQMNDVIKGCGGECISWEKEGPKTFYELSKSPKEHLIVKTENDEQNVSFNAVLSDMLKQKRRAIPLNEIALAIVYCSCEINCNPNFNKVSEVFGSRSQKLQTMGILAAETESENMGPTAFEVKTEKVIPPSIEDDWALSVPNPTVDLEELAGPSGIKRPSVNQNDVGGFKKPKTEGAEMWTKGNDMLKGIETIASAPPKESSNEKSEESCFKNKSHPSQKRKAEEDLEDSNTKKSNPFSLIKVTINKRNKTTDEENPFEITRVSNKSSKNSSIKYENPFARIPNLSRSTHDITEVKDENFRPQYEPRKEIKLIPNKSDITIMSSSKRSFLNLTWMSKNTSMVKNEMKEEDTELQKIAEAFKNCVKVEVLSVYNRPEKSRNCLNDTSVDNDNGKKNFKRFKKVRPIRPQVTIIPRNQLTRIAPGDVTGIQISDLNDSDDDAGSNNGVKQKAKQKVKKFVL